MRDRVWFGSRRIANEHLKNKVYKDLQTKLDRLFPIDYNIRSYLKGDLNEN